MKPEKQVGRRATLSVRSARVPVSRRPRPRRSLRGAAADSGSNEEKRKARYQANSPDVQRLSAASIVIQRSRTEEAAVLDQQERKIMHGTACWRARCQIIRRKAALFDRRSFLRRSGLVAGSLATVGVLQLGSVRKAEAGPPPPARRGAHPPQEHVHSLFGGLFGHCRGRKMVCGLDRSLTYDSPINRGSHAAKGAAAGDDVPDRASIAPPDSNSWTVQWKSDFLGSGH